MVKLDLAKVADKAQLSFQMLVCMRDIVSIAKKKSTMPTYERALELFHDFNPELYSQIVESLPQRNLSDEARLLIARAQSESKEANVSISPIDVLEEELAKYNEYIEKAPKTDYENLKLFYNKVGTLQQLRKSLKPRKLTENRILTRDTSYANRTDFGASMIQQDDFYVDYKLEGGKYLRIRLLHPDEAEHITGADLIYEQHMEGSGMIRIMFLQYKIWDNGVLYFSQAKNLLPQLDRMKTALCDKGFCSGPKLPEGKSDYRFPYCCAFLRPTDKLQISSSKLVSTGLHIPICHLRDNITTDTEKLDKKALRGTMLNHELFEPLFNLGYLGSTWIHASQIKEFYTESKILEKDDTVTFYAREIKPEDSTPIIQTDR